jgi:hypothetical protein
MIRTVSSATTDSIAQKTRNCTFYFGIIRPAVISKTTKKKEWSTLWVTLMLQMLCWFILHDFDPKDIKIVPSNLRGSRIPVYIG